MIRCLCSLCNALAHVVSSSVWILGVLVLAFALAGCKPRQIVPRNPLLLLSTEREAIQYRRLVLPNRLKVMLVWPPEPSLLRTTEPV